ncbi:MAG: PilN domain-containing protein [Pseudomonadota bacterium]|nr:PilN domain-containing protein [Pseudomonadota bacterium]
MARINLLPWRETERKRRQRQLAVMAAAAVAATLVAGLALHTHFERLISIQESRNQFLQREISRFDRQIEEIKELEETRSNLLARMEIIQELQQSRPEVVHLFDEVVSAIPAGVFLTSIKQSGHSVILEGRAQSNARVSALMRSIEASQWIGNPQLLLIENKEQTGTGLSHFRLAFTQVGQENDEQDAEG